MSSAWVGAIERNDAAELRRLCRERLLGSYYRDGNADCNALGLAIARSSPLLWEIIKYGDPHMFVYPCYIPPIGSGFLPYHLAMVYGNTLAVAMLERVGVTPHMSFRTSLRWVEQHLSAERARRAALMLISARKNNDGFEGIPRDVVWLIARAVYATRTDEAWL